MGTFGYFQNQNDCFQNFNLIVLQSCHFKNLRRSFRKKKFFLFKRKKNIFVNFFFKLKYNLVPLQYYFSFSKFKISNVCHFASG